MRGRICLSTIRYAAALLPAAILLVVAILINARQSETGRAQRVADHARLAAASVDLRLGQLLELTSFCATAPALLERVDFERVAESCGRYASRIGAWVVIVETGEMHRQILNTRPDAPATLPRYPRGKEHATLRVLEERSRETGEPGIADVFTGIILPEGIVSAGQYLRLADGRDAMLYVSLAARALSDQLAELAVPEGPIFALIDPSRRIVARSVDIERAMFADAPDWILGFMEAGTAGAALGVPGPEVIGGTWDAGYQPLENAPGWMAAAFQPTPVGARLWAPLSLPSAVVMAGLLISGLFFWEIASRDAAARRLAAAREAEAEAERQNREKSRLLASFAHDIRSPLIGLIGSLEIPAEGSGAETDRIPAARGAAETLLQLVDDILELSFLGSGELTLHPSPVDLHQLVATLSDQVRGLAGRKGLAFRLDLDPDLPPVVEVDRLRLQQVLTNLLTNAVKYTERGAVTLRIRLAGGTAKRATLDLSVIDTGIGLAPGDIPRILREFGRLEREAERRESGTGLGLAIVQRILQGMGTLLEVEGAEGQGSTFRFRLTLPVPAGRALPDAARPLAGTLILYAEDEPVIRQVTTRRLEEAGAQVVSAVDGEDALHRLEDMTPDLLLIDLQMPGLDGVGVLRRLEETLPDRAYPVFVLTSYISGPQTAEAGAAGAAAVFTKPLQVAALAAAFQARRGDGGRSTPWAETPHTSDEPLLDPDTFLDLSGVFDPDEAAAFVAEFEQSVRVDLAALRAALDTGDMTKACDVAHRVQGLCLVMGAAGLAARLRGIEEAALETDAALARSRADDLNPMLAATLVTMRAALEPPAAARTSPAA